MCPNWLVSKFLNFQSFFHPKKFVLEPIFNFSCFFSSPKICPWTGVPCSQDRDLASHPYGSIELPWILKKFNLFSVMSSIEHFLQYFVRGPGSRLLPSHHRCLVIQIFIIWVLMFHNFPKLYHFTPHCPQWP